jgi:hypothetical protein
MRRPTLLSLFHCAPPANHSRQAIRCFVHRRRAIGKRLHRVIPLTKRVHPAPALSRTSGRANAFLFISDAYIISRLRCRSRATPRASLSFDPRRIASLSETMYDELLWLNGTSRTTASLFAIALTSRCCRGTGVTTQRRRIERHSARCLNNESLAAQLRSQAVGMRRDIERSRQTARARLSLDPASSAPRSIRSPIRHEPDPTKHAAAARPVRHATQLNQFPPPPRSRATSGRARRRCRHLPASRPNGQVDQ